MTSVGSRGFTPALSGGLGETVSQLSFGILGPLETTRDGEAIELGAAKQRALLALLLIHANQVVPVDRLVDELWGEQPPPSATSALQVYISALRKALEPDRPARAPATVLLTRPPGYLIRVDAEQLDLLRFEELAADGRAALEAAEPDRAAARFDEALALWRGPALAEFTYERFAEREAARLEELHLSVAEDRVDAELGLGRHDVVVGELEALVAEHPLRERLSGQLMLALYRSGRQAEALRVFQKLRGALGEELGIEPSPSLRKLEEAILLQKEELEWQPAGITDAAARRRALVESEDKAVVPLPALLAARDRVPFVGRANELERLEDLWQEAAAGGRRLVLLAGEPGIGKTRLATEAAASAHDRGATVLYGRSDDQVTLPFQPFVQALEHYVAHAPVGVLREHVGRHGGELTRLVPELSRRMRDVPEPPAVEPEVERYRLFEAVASLLDAAADRTPLLLILEDLHWADQATLLLLRHLGRSRPDAATLVLATYRATDLSPGHPLTGVLADLAREPSVDRVALEGLGDEDVQSLIGAAAGGTDVATAGGELAAAVRRETAGNPFFIRETVRHLVETAGLQREEVRISGATVDDFGIPDSVKDVITSRVGRLSETAQRLLRVAAVMGSEFDAGLLGEVAEAKEPDLLDALDEAVGAGLVGEVTSGSATHGFSHALVRQTLFDGLGSVRRARLHERVGEAIVSAGREERQLGDLAYHFFEAAGPNLERAVEYARRAADQAMAQLAYEEAVAHLERACAAADAAPAPIEVRADLFLELGDAQWRAGQEAASQLAFRRAAALARDLSDQDRLARGAIGAAGIGFQGGSVDVEAVSLLEEALAAVGPDPTPLRARTLAAYARSFPWADQPDKMLPVTAEAVALARQLGDLETLGSALAAQFLATLPQSSEASAGVAEALVAVTEASGDLSAQAEAHAYALTSQLELCDRAAALTELDALRRVADRTRQPLHRWYVLSWEATVAAMEGRFADARALAQDAVTIGYPLRGTDATVAYMTHTSLATWSEGDIANVIPGLDAFFTENSTGSWVACRVWALAEAGRHDEARAELARLSADGFASSDRNFFRRPTLHWLANATIVVGATEHAARLYELLAPAGRTQCMIPTWFAGGVSGGAVAFYLGGLSALQGHWDAAFAHFEDAIELNEAMGARPWLAWTYYRYGEAVRASDGVQAGAKARELFERAGGLADEVGMPYLTEQLQGAVNRPSSG